MTDPFEVIADQRLNLVQAQLKRNGGFNSSDSLLLDFDPECVEIRIVSERDEVQAINHYAIIESGKRKNLAGLNEIIGRRVVFSWAMTNQGLTDAVQIEFSSKSESDVPPVLQVSAKAGILEISLFRPKSITELADLP